MPESQFSTQEQILALKRPLNQVIDNAEQLLPEEFEVVAAEILPLVEDIIQKAIEKHNLTLKINQALTSYLESNDQDLQKILTECNISAYEKRKGQILLERINERLPSLTLEQAERIMQGLEELNTLSAGVFANHFRIYVNTNIIPLVNAKYPQKN